MDYGVEVKGGLRKRLIKDLTKKYQVQHYNNFTRTYEKKLIYLN